LVQQFENLALEKVTKYRDISVKSTTLSTLRSGRHSERPTKDMRHLGASRLLDRREILAQQEKLRQREEKAKQKEINKLAREKAKEERERVKKPPPKRVCIILHVKPRSGEGSSSS
jgi:FtsZ-interacting cell division protein ZipA